MHPGVRYELQELEKLISSGDQTIHDEKQHIALRDAVKKEIENTYRIRYNLPQPFLKNLSTSVSRRSMELPLMDVITRYR